MNDTTKTGPIPKPSAWQAQAPAQAALQMPQAPQVDPARERQPREEIHTQERRRRKNGTLNRMIQYKLDCIPAEMLDLDNYVYRWVNDESNKLRMATKHDDYDHVGTSELQGFDPDSFDSQGSETIRMLAGQDKFGNPIYTYLLKKRRSFWEADNEEVVRAREDMMAGRVYRGEIGDSFEDRDEMRDAGYNPDIYYAPKDNQMGGASERRKGPIPKRIIR